MDHAVLAVLLVLAGAAGGGLNALAGGGTFITFPALLLAGLPPISAVTTGTVALVPGYISAAAALRDQLMRTSTSDLVYMFVSSIAGGLLGSLLLLVTPAESFRDITPWLVLVATGAFAFSDEISRFCSFRPTSKLRKLSLLMVTTYGGYFNGGLGVMLLTHAAVFGQSDLIRAQAQKNFISALLTTVAVASYALGGRVDWVSATYVTFGALIGGYFGALWSARFRTNTLRGIVVTIGLLVALGLFFWW